MLGNNHRTLPENVGILAMDIHFPKKFVDQEELEKFDGVSAGKYTIGLGQLKMAVCDDREDINSICLSVVTSLLAKYNIELSQIGRLEVGTETIIDKSKSVKTVLMQLFQNAGNTEIEGIDTTNACYGGTNALFNAINWVESSSWDGRLALVVAADIAVYKSGAARPTGGAGAVAILVGPNAPLVFDQGLRATHMEHVYDFYKPDLHSEYPEVDGPLSNTCYIKAIDTCYNRFVEKYKKLARIEKDVNMTNIGDYYVFHSPYTKLVQKSFARLLFNDFINDPENELFAAKREAFEPFLSIPKEKTYGNRDIEKAFMDMTKEMFNAKVGPGLLAGRNLGNMYCGSLYGGLVSLVSNVASQDLQQKRVVLFSYGSGLASSMFSLKVVGSTQALKDAINLEDRLKKRTKIEPSQFDEIMKLRENTHNVKSYVPVSSLSVYNVWEGSWVLDKVDEKFRRSYLQIAN